MNRVFVCGRMRLGARTAVVFQFLCSPSRNFDMVKVFARQGLEMDEDILSGHYFGSANETWYHIGNEDRETAQYRCIMFSFLSLSCAALHPNAKKTKRQASNNTMTSAPQVLFTTIRFPCRAPSSPNTSERFTGQVQQACPGSWYHVAIHQPTPHHRSPLRTSASVPPALV